VHSAPARIWLCEIDDLEQVATLLAESGAMYSDVILGTAQRAARLFFAGEATHRRHPASVWGASESGLREARNIRAKFG
jgi:hypothetical protein